MQPSPDGSLDPRARDGRDAHSAHDEHDAHDAGQAAGQGAAPDAPRDAAREDGTGPAGSGESAPTQVRRLRIRRSVNYPAFLLTGAVVGVIVGGLLEFLGPGGTTETGGAVYTAISSLSYLAMFFGLVGCLIGGIVALVLDRRRSSG